MQRIDVGLKRIFDGKRPLTDDEYLLDGLIYCKNCNTPRQARSGDDPDVIYPSNCECRQAQYDAEEKARQKADHEQRVSELRQSGIPNPSYRKYTFNADDGKTPKITKICKNYVSEFETIRKSGGGLLLWGSVGTGKSFYAMCIANALIDKEYAVQSTSLASVVKMAQDFDNADAHFSRLMRKSLIVIDDLGTERSTSFAHEQIYKFIDGCYTHNIPLVITTNYTPSILTVAANDTTDVTYARIYSRILERCLPVKVNEIMRRENKGKEVKAKMEKLLQIEND